MRNTQHFAFGKDRYIVLETDSKNYTSLEIKIISNVASVLLKCVRKLICLFIHFLRDTFAYANSLNCEVCYGNSSVKLNRRLCVCVCVSPMLTHI
jgi:hypothetical protein